MRARIMSARLCTIRVASHTKDSFSATPTRRSAMARSMTPPLDVSRPPSKAAVIFLREAAGNENGRIVSSVMASVATSGWSQQPNPAPCGSRIVFINEIGIHQVEQQEDPEAIEET